jgi:glutamyl-tRNA reductase
LVCSTAAPRAVVLPEHVKPALAARGDRPLCILDIALPRDVDPAVGKLDNVFLYDLDDLQAVVTANLERRRAEVPSAEELIAAAADKFWQWVVSLSVVPTLAELRAQMEALRLRELAGALRRLDQLSPSERAVVEDLTRTLMNKFLHSPSVRLRAAAAEGRDLSMADALRYLFDLDPAHDTTSEPVLANRETTE